ncbi:MAG: phosphatase PAP2 family protein [Bacteroidota bacterium]
MAQFRRAFFVTLFCAFPLFGQHSDPDTRLFRAINNSQNPARDGFLEYLDYSSLPSFGAIPLGFFVVGAAADNHTAVQVGIMSAAGQAMTLGVTLALKEIIGRPRPFDTLEGVKVKHQWSTLGLSFPSGHTSQAFTIATVISLSYNDLAITIPMFLWAGAVGYGRVYLGVHYPSDIVGGMAIGIAGGFAAWSLRKEIRRISDNFAPPDAALRSGFSDFRLASLRIPL